MTGPSASGSENGTPTSRTSAPARSSASRISPERSRSGSPAVIYVTRPVSPASRSARKRSLIRDTVRLLHELFDGLHVLVTSARKVDHDESVRPKLPPDAAHVRDGVRGFERGDDAFEPREFAETLECALIG